ncbi:hypothetical protein [Pseudothauera rhizosphaerae]|uniref:Uncharacterized protein n=1 Tax=Pseudothauera rhizosphaerae TaxID=2565932 RepID=A0A4S4AF61_9RHOO|nr:hypothetical protein [Pseudothauera rhizosphaerae]THF56894.1 hypothetical protein E6O51_18865 [Pseudothauera rhizosphaerae]
MCERPHTPIACQHRSLWPEEHPWREGLPVAWRDQVVAPLDFEIHRDEELAAQRVFGRDADGTPCYYAHAWTMSEPCSDDDEEFYLVATAGESVTAWRLRDERWLVRRVVMGNERCVAPQPFYVFSESMPR